LAPHISKSTNAADYEVGPRDEELISKFDDPKAFKWHMSSGSFEGEASGVKVGPTSGCQ